MQRVLTNIAVDPDYLTLGTTPPLGACVEVGGWKPLALTLYLRDGAGAALPVSEAAVTVELLSIRSGLPLTLNAEGPYELRDRVTVYASNVAPGSLFVRVKATEGVPPEAGAMVIEVAELPIGAALPRAAGEVVVYEYVRTFTLADLTGDDHVFQLDDFPENVSLVHGACYLVADGVASDGDTDNVQIYISSWGVTNYILYVGQDWSGRQYMAIQKSTGLHKSEPIELGISAWIGADDPGELADISGSFTVVVRYIKTTS